MQLIIPKKLQRNWKLKNHSYISSSIWPGRAGQSFWGPSTKYVHLVFILDKKGIKMVQEDDQKGTTCCLFVCPSVRPFVCINSLCIWKNITLDPAYYSLLNQILNSHIYFSLFDQMQVQAHHTVLALLGPSRSSVPLTPRAQCTTYKLLTLMYTILILLILLGF